MEQRCLACHTEVAFMKTLKRGLHAHVKDACAKCHPDHGGRDFKLIAWEEGTFEKFDHQRTAWALEGKHDSLTCDKCHKPQFQGSDVMSKLQRKNKTKSWFGLDTACIACHEDVHHGQLGQQCEKCHTPKGWKPVPNFDHSRARYPLLGKHATVECAKCHEAAQLPLQRDAKGKIIPIWRPLEFSDCNTCHLKDPHEGKFGKTCANCHQNEGWHVIKKSAFNHDLTKYPLRGKHSAVDCAKCHDPKTAWGKTPPFAKCGDCHRDAHKGQATMLGKPADCAACHKVEGFDLAVYTVAQHQGSKYPLEGRHAAAECSHCHVRRPEGPEAVAALGPARVLMRPAKSQCVECHLDPHQGRFSPGGERAQSKQCMACHNMDGFRPSLFGAQLHAKARFKLDGAHLAVPCQTCHVELKVSPSTSTLKDANGARTLRFVDSRQRCAACHESPHGDQFATHKDKGACESCHGADAFKPASKFDHQKDSTFKLDGAHIRVACSGCHRSETLASGKTRVIYKPVLSRCEDCHGTSLPPLNRGSSSRIAPGFDGHEPRLLMHSGEVPHAVAL